MESINSLRDLEPYGVKPLTGEACALALRMLCDLTEQGCELVSEAYGLNRHVAEAYGANRVFAENWNSGAIASCMLAYDAWRLLGVVALIRASRYHTVFSTEDGTVWGLEHGERLISPVIELVDEPDGTLEIVEHAPYRLSLRDDDIQDWPTCYGKIARVYVLGSNPHVGTRNVHAMSGRVT